MSHIVTRWSCAIKTTLTSHAWDNNQGRVISPRDNMVDRFKGGAGPSMARFQQRYAHLHVSGGNSDCEIWRVLARRLLLLTSRAMPWHTTRAAPHLQTRSALTKLPLAEPAWTGATASRAPHHLPLLLPLPPLPLPLPLPLRLLPPQLFFLELFSHHSDSPNSSRSFGTCWPTPLMSSASS